MAKKVTRKKIGEDNPQDLNAIADECIEALENVEHVDGVVILVAHGKTDASKFARCHWFFESALVKRAFEYVTEEEADSTPTLEVSPEEDEGEEA